MTSVAVADGLMAVPWLGVTLLLGVSAWRLARRWLPDEAPEPRAVLALLLGWAAVVLVAVLLGSIGTLSGPALLGGVGTLAALPLVAGPAPRPGAGAARPVWAWVWPVLLAAWAGHVLSSGLLTFPNHWDGLTYHVPLVDRWLQSRSLYVPGFSHWSHPGNNELLGLWAVAPFSGDFLLGLSNLPVAALLLAATIGLAREVGASPLFAKLAGLAVCLNLVFIGQLVSFENDLAVAALTTAALYTGLRYARRGGVGDMAGWATSLGLLAGVKFYALGYAAVVGVVVPLLALHRRGLGAAVRLAGVGLLGAILLSGYWYARNTLATGRPLYPLGASASTSDIDRIYPDVWRSTVLGCRRPEAAGLTLLAVAKIGGPCQLLVLCAFPLAGAWLLGAGGRAAPGVAAARRALVFAAVGAGAVWLVTPFAVECQPGQLDQLLYERTPVRYALAFLSLAAVAGACAAEGAAGPRRARRVASALGVLLAAQCGVALANPERGLTPEVRRGLHVEVIDTALYALNFLLAGYLFLRLRRAAPRWAAAALPAGLTAAALGVAALSSAWQAGYERYYGRMFHDNLVAELTNLGVPDGARLCVLEDRPYPFFGPRRQFRVSVPLVLDDGAALADFLDNQASDFLVVRARSSPFPCNVAHNQHAAEWAARLSARLALVRAGPSYDLYRVTPKLSE